MLLAEVYRTLLKVLLTLYGGICVVKVRGLLVSAAPVAYQQVAENSCREADKRATDLRNPNVAVSSAPRPDSLKMFRKYCLDENRGEKAKVAILKSH